MKKKSIATFGILFLLFALMPSANVTPALAQTCTDAAGGVIPCPPTQEPTGDDGNDGPTGSDSNVPTLRFLAADENYLNPENWNNGGRIPGAGQTALLDGQFAVIDPRDPNPIPLGNLTLRNGARLVIYDAFLQFETLDSDGSAIEVYNSYLKADVFIDPFGGFSLNPSFLEAERIVLYKPETPARFGLGGDQPASPTALGPGHYARMQGNSIDLDGQLSLFSIYGFHPQPGDTFEIITNTGDNAINGAFANAPEGAVIDGFCNVQLRITYAGGDGNDVILTAEARTDPDPNCNEDFSNPRPDGNVFLEASSADLEHEQPIEVQDIQLVNGAEWNLYNAIVTARIVDSTNSTINLFNSYLKVNTFIDPFGGFSLNPSFLEAERIVLYKPETPARFGLGGDQPASPTALGPGHYARMQGNSIDLDGQLELFLVYGFSPDPGDTFEIITNTGGNRINGTFANAPEGAVVGGYCDVELVISYAGGDGNDVTLTAQQSANPNPEWECASTAPESQPEPAQEMDSKTNTTPYLIGGGILVLIILLAVVFRKRPA